MEMVCLQCGDKGVTNAFVYCVKCLDFAVHRYCLDVIPKTVDEFVQWSCDDCEVEMQNQPVVLKRDVVQCQTRDCAASKHITRNYGIRTEENDIAAADEGKICKQSSPQQLGEGKINNNLVQHDKLLVDTHLEESMKKRRSAISISIMEKGRGHKLGDNSSNRAREKCSNIDISEHIKLVSDSTLSMEVKENKANPCSDTSNGHTSNLCEEFSKDSFISSMVDCHMYAGPVITPIWRGSFNISNKNDDILDGLMAHTSSRACQKVYDEASQLLPVLHLEMLPKSDVWPKRFEKSKPSGETIALYFFPSDIRSERVFDHLVDEMLLKELAMRAVLLNTELLIFTSRELPIPYWRFKDKYYIWGVFRGTQHSTSCSESCRGEVEVRLDNA